MLFARVWSHICLLGLLQRSYAQNSIPSSEVQLPQCAVSCLVAEIPQSPCLPNNLTCICANDSVQESVTACVVASCTIKEALTTKNLTSIACNAPVRDRRALYNDMSTTFGIISGIAVVLRFGTKWIVKSDSMRIWYDDLFVALTLLTGIPGTVLNVHGLTANGLGKDTWTVSFKQITDFLHVFYAMEIMYFAEVALIKLSILFFYLRIFPGPTVRLLIRVTIVVDITFGIIFVFLALFQCQPVSYYWKRWDGEHSGKCMDVNAMAFANAAISIALDLWMLGFALFQIIRLNLHWNKKLAIMLMFGVGTLDTIISMVRLESLVTFANSSNPTWDNWESGLWSTIEINIGIICACMPFLRLLFVKVFPWTCSSSSSPSSIDHAYFLESQRHSTMTFGFTNHSGSHCQSRLLSGLNNMDANEPRWVGSTPGGLETLRPSTQDSAWRGRTFSEYVDFVFGGIDSSKYLTLAR